MAMRLEEEHAEMEDSPRMVVGGVPLIRPRFPISFNYLKNLRKSDKSDKNSEVLQVEPQRR